MGFFRASLWQSVWFDLGHRLPWIASGLFRERPIVARIIRDLHPDFNGERLGRLLRPHPGVRGVWVGTFASKSLLLFDPCLIQRVLALSPQIYGPPRAKVLGMSHYQPGALTTSTGDSWLLRRRFHERLFFVNTKGSLERFGTIVGDEVKSLLGKEGSAIQWTDLSAAFSAITLRVIFGDAARDRYDLISDLDRLRSRANWLCRPRRAQPLCRFRQAIEHLLCTADSSSLAGLARECGREEMGMDVVSQVTHWTFAMQDTLANNVTAALALIANDEVTLQRIRVAIEAEGPLDETVDYLLSGCFREAMRLWPTTPFLVRQTRIADLLGDEILPAGVQVIIWNGFNHRDDFLTPDANRFRPSRWSEPVTAERPYYPLSGGAQSCVGGPLATFLASAFLREFLSRCTFSCVRPRWASGGVIPNSFDSQAFEITKTS